MDKKKVIGSSMIAAILLLNVVLAAGGVYYFKDKDRQKKEIELSEEKAFNEEVEKYNADVIQEAVSALRTERENSIAGNPDAITKETIVKVERYIPPVTETVKVTETKPSKTTKSS